MTSSPAMRRMMRRSSGAVPTRTGKSLHAAGKSCASGSNWPTSVSEWSCLPPRPACGSESRTCFAGGISILTARKSASKAASVRTETRTLKALWQQQRRNEAPEEFNWHALRHFAISCWIDAGLPPKTVQTFAGHSSLQVTMDRYGHLFKSDDHKKAMDAIAADMFG